MLVWIDFLPRGDRDGRDGKVGASYSDIQDMSSSLQKLKQILSDWDSMMWELCEGVCFVVFFSRVFE